MEEVQRKAIRTVKARIAAMLEERNALVRGDTQSESSNVLAPSKYWSDFCASFDYMIGLPEESFQKLRIHTYHLTGDNYLSYCFDDPEEFRRKAGIESLTAGLPDRYVLNEPKGGIGFHWDGRFVSHDTLRFQRVITALYRSGVLPKLEKPKRRRILEIGGGYGALAHHLVEGLGATTYVIVDLPETLLFSASYLALLRPELKHYVYDPASAAQMLSPRSLDSFDFVFVPNYAFSRLDGHRFDFALNIASLQEMRQTQVVEYLDSISQIADLFFSSNQDHHPRNRELSSLADLLAARFDAEELTQPSPDRIARVRNVTVRTAKRVMDGAFRLLTEPHPVLPTREFLCRPRLGSPSS